MFELLWPWALCLLPAPLLMRWLPPGKRPQAALRVPFFASWSALTGGARGVGAQAPLAQLLLWPCWLGLVLALARPQWTGEPVQLPSSGRDLMLAVDLSGSMRIEDMLVDDRVVRRIDAVRAVGADFIERREGDRLGLILFGSRAYVQSPLSFDTETVRQFLLEAQIGFAGQETAIGDAIGLAVKRLREHPGNSRVIILLTDGRDNTSQVDPLEAAGLAASQGIRIHTIGIGADSGALPGLLGSSVLSQRFNPSADLDEATLREMAERTGGRYFRAHDPRELATIYRTLDELEPVEADSATFRPRRAYTHVPLLGALLASFVLALHRLWPPGRRSAQPDHPAGAVESRQASHG